MPDPHLIDEEDFGSNVDAHARHSPDGGIHACRKGRASRDRAQGVWGTPAGTILWVWEALLGHRTRGVGNIVGDTVSTKMQGALLEMEGSGGITRRGV